MYSNSRKMRCYFFLFVVVMTVFVIIERICYRQVEDINVNWDTRWGDRNDDEAPVRFFIDTNPNYYNLQNKLSEFLSRPAPRVQSDPDDWSRGIPYSHLHSMVEHWNSPGKYNWTKRAEMLNNLGPQYRTSINGLYIHYFDIRAKSNGNKNTPILLLHGWPGSFTEFTDVIPFLLEQGHDLVIPSLPGFGYSEGPIESKVSSDLFTYLDASVIFSKLMKKVHPRKRYVCQGGDYGSFSCSALAQIDRTGNLIGVHLNFAVVAVPPWPVGGLASWGLIFAFPYLLSDSNRQRMAPSVPAVLLRLLQETGYFHIQGSKPDTIGQGLDDSPIFLLAYLAEKMRTWTVPKDQELITVDEILDNVQIYWNSRSSNSAARWYYNFVRSWDGAVASLLAPVPVKTAILDAPGEIFRPPDFWLKPHRFPNLVRFTETDRGGHFLALECPEALAKDLLAFIDQLLNE